MKRIALVVPWVGPLPWYWDVWRRSAAERCFDVIVVRKTAAEFKALAERKLGTFVNLQAGYKLCDLKPMTGVLFEDWLKGYDYWAFGDCDLMYGRLLDEWIRRALAADCEVATVQGEFISGPFTLVKNNAKCNHLFERVSGWKDMMAQARVMAFDELGEGWFRKWLWGERSYEQLRQEQDSFSALCWRERTAGRLRLVAEPVIYEEMLAPYECVTYGEDGAVVVHGQERVIFHFIGAKGRFGFTGDDRSVWVSRGGPFVRDVGRFAWRWLRGDRAARRRVAEWFERRRGNPDWWKGEAWNLVVGGGAKG